MLQKENNKEKIRELLSSQAKHGCYQMIPPDLLFKMPELIKYNFSIRLDDRRYNWFSGKLDFAGRKVMDIGANIGYFAFRLTSEKKAIITAYEPYKSHADAIATIQKIIEIEESQFTCVNESIGIDDIDNLPDQDIILFFNVLQHAGEDYDSAYVKNIAQWREYAVKYLSKLALKTHYLIFQMGYSWIGHGDKLCEDEEIIDFTVSLLKEAGWTINNCGVISNVLRPTYKDIFINKTSNRHPIINKKDMIISRLMNKIKLLRMDYRFLQRPLFICKSAKK